MQASTVYTTRACSTSSRRHCWSYCSSGGTSPQLFSNMVLTIKLTRPTANIITTWRTCTRQAPLLPSVDGTLLIKSGSIHASSLAVFGLDKVGTNRLVLHLKPSNHQQSRVSLLRRPHNRRCQLLKKSKCSVMSRYLPSKCLSRKLWLNSACCIFPLLPALIHGFL